MTLRSPKHYNPQTDQTMLRRRRTRIGNRRRRRQPRGFALVETVGMILVVGLLLSLSASVLNRAFGVHRDSLHTFRQLEQMQTWAERFRSDAHAADTVDVQPEKIALERSDGTVVTYQVEDTGMIRQVTDESQTMLGQDDWNALGIARAEWVVDRDQRYPLLLCRLTFAADSHVPLECVARLGDSQANSRGRQETEDAP